MKIKGATPVSDTERMGEGKSMSPLSSEKTDGRAVKIKLCKAPLVQLEN